MIFESENFYVDVIENEDLNEIMEVYNSNKHFLAAHMDQERVTEQWIMEEMESMKEAGFYSCKIVENKLEKIIGIMDFKTSEETYLSLLMLHHDFKGKGFGNLIFQAFEAYVKSLKSSYIKIDVVMNYDDSVLGFWVRNGFTKFSDVELNWTGKRLSAISMKKNL